MRSNGTHCAALAIAAIAAGCGADGSAPLAEPEGFAKAFLEGGEWKYTRTYEATERHDCLRNFEARASVILNEDTMIVQLIGEPFTSRDGNDALAAAWRIVDHTPNRPAPCPRYEETGTIWVECLPWHERSHFIPDFARPLLSPSNTDDDITAEVVPEQRPQLEVIFEDGLLVVAEFHEVRCANPPSEPFEILVRHQVERVTP